MGVRGLGGFEAPKGAKPPFEPAVWYGLNQLNLVKIARACYGR